MNKKIYSLKELEQNIDLNEFTKDYCSDDGLDFPELCEKYNGSITNLKRYIGSHKLKRSKAYVSKKRKQTNLEKYGTEYASQNKEIQEKIKNTFVEKYGTEYAFQNEDVKNKIKQTNLQKYGTEYVLQNENVKNKMKQTNIEKYGSMYALQNEDIKQKIKQTNLNKYGVENPLQNKEIREKITQTNLQKYGTSCPLQNEEVKNKKKQTCMDKYGVEYFCQTEKCRNASNGAHSKPNEEFAQLLDQNNIIYSREFPLKNKSYDFKIRNILIEINPTPTHNSTFGVHSKNGLVKNYHKNKSQLAVDNNFQCIHVFDWDTQSKIIALLRNNKTIYARKCEIKELPDNKEYQNFINSNHLQGYCKGNKIIIGLYYKNELIEVMSFGKPRYNKNYQYELLRLCTKTGYSIIGGAEKIFNYFISKYNPTSIISYCDIAKFSGNIYQKLGFVIKHDSAPTKHWYNMKTKQHITDNLLRQRGFDQLFDTNYGKGTSNEELMLEHGFVEIYDCGQATYIWKREE